jgi:hypothetical protein
MRLYPERVDSAYLWCGNRTDRPGREWVAESVKSKKNLVICIGDSWTWGDSLGESHQGPKYNDTMSRYSQFYTSLLAEKLNADWMMIAWCGQSNKWILDQYQIIKKAIHDGFYGQYSEVYVHVCLTEIFRDLEDFAWFKPKFINDFDLFCKDYFETFVLRGIRGRTAIPDKHRFSANFWDMEIDHKSCNFVEKTWQQLLFDKTKIKDEVYVPVVSGIGIDPLVKWLREKNLKELERQFSEKLIDIKKRVDNMMLCDLNNKHATRHPTAEGHRIWADHLYHIYK